MLFEPLESRLLFAANAAVSIAADPSRQVLDIEAAWKFNKSNPSSAQKTSFDDSDWSNVNLPHTWNAKDGEDGGGYYRGVGWYRKTLDLPAAFNGKKVYIQFDGASVTADVYVNGTKVGSHAGAFAAFTFDITDEIKPGQPNLIAVKVNNANNKDIAPISGKNVTLGGPDFTVFGGLYRAVSLIATNTSHITMADNGASGVYIDQSHVSSASADLDIRAKVRNDTSSSEMLTVVADVVDAGGNVVDEISKPQTISGNTTLQVEQSTTLNNPHLWNGTRDPYEYSVVVKVLDGTGTVVDAVKQPLGIRSFKVDPKNGFFLNGQYVDLHGVDYHQDRIDKGWAKLTADTDQDISIMREMGVNFVRMSHYQQDQYTYDAFDKAGIIVWSEIPYVYDDTNSSAFRDNLKQQLVEEIRQNYNHPSVMFWGLYNGLNNDSGANSLVPQLQKLADQQDPGRKTIGAGVERAGIGSKVNTYTDVIGYNDYFGWYRGSYNDIGDFLDSYHHDSPNRAVAISEYGAGGSIKQHKENPSNITATDGKFHPEEYQALFHENQWRQLKDRKYVFAKTVFSMFDFASDDRNEGDTKGRNDKGLVTYDRKTKKDAFYFYKANWTNTPFAYITSRRYTNRPSKTVEVKVYSTLASLTLNVNGKTIGTSNGNNINVFKWSNIHLKSGSNTIAVSGTRDGQTYSDTVTWNA